MNDARKNSTPRRLCRSSFPNCSPGRKVKCLPVVESSELKLSGFFPKSSAAVEFPGQTQEAPLVGCSPENEQRTMSSTYESVANVQPDPESIDQDSPA